MAKDLAQRVAAHRTNGGGNGNGNRNGVEQASQSMEQHIRSMESQFALAMPRGAEAGQLIRDAITAIRRTPKLAQCEWRTVVGGLMTCAQLGLRPGVLGHAWLLPFWNARNRQFEAQLIIGYQGYVELAHRSGKVASTIARTVYEHDTFEVDYGLADSLVHKPELAVERGNAVAYYAIGKTTTGGHAFVVVGHGEMIKHRDRHAMARDKSGNVVGPWRDNFDAMANKTTFLQLAKWLPKSADLATAIAVDGSVRLDVTPDADPAQVSDYIEGEVVEGGGDIADPTDEHPAASGTAEPDPPTGDQPGDDEPPTADTVTDAQLRKLHTAMTHAGMTRRDARLAHARKVTGHSDLESTSHLSKAEASRIIDALESGEATGDQSEPEPAPTDEASRLVAVIRQTATDSGMTAEELAASFAHRYGGQVLDGADLADLSDFSEYLRDSAEAGQS